MGASRGSLHHLEIWVADLATGLASWGWLLGELGYAVDGTWDHGATWRLGDAYVVVESGPDVLPGAHERRRPGVNHLAFHAGTRADVEALVAAGPDHGWTLLFADRHPYAGGPQHYAAYLEDAAGFEVELVADHD
jgi:catechol 2,3-dioxygenase-like lactoylglutathione lyase family enzyme